MPPRDILVVVVKPAGERRTARQQHMIRRCGPSAQHQKTTPWAGRPTGRVGFTAHRRLSAVASKKGTVIGSTGESMSVVQTSSNRGKRPGQLGARSASAYVNRCRTPPEDTVSGLVRLNQPGAHHVKWSHIDAREAAAGVSVAKASGVEDQAAVRGSLTTGAVAFRRSVRHSTAPAGQPRRAKPSHPVRSQ